MNEIIYGLAFGAVAALVLGALVRWLSGGFFGNFLWGVLGGGIGGDFWERLGFAGGSDIVNGAAGGSIGGALLLVIVGILKGILGTKKVAEEEAAEE